MNSLPNPGFKMMRLPVVALASLLFACSSGADDATPAKPAEVAKSPAATGQPTPGDNKINTGSLTPLRETDLNALRERAMAYLELIRINDIASAYRMEFGSGDGSLSPLRFNQIRPGGLLLDYAIKDVLVQDGEGVVKTTVKVVLPEMRTPYDTTWEMRWVMQDGTLYHKSRQPDETATLGQILN